MKLEEQVNMDIYFSISKINPERMRVFGITLSINELRELARKRPAFKKILTGSNSDDRKRRLTKIYRYEDFKDEKIAGNL